jgi:transposase
MRRSLGVDLHTTNFVVCFLSEQGGSRVVTFALTTEGLTAFRRQLRADDAIAVEAGQTAYYFYDQIQNRVKEVVLVNPPRFALISRSQKKTDRHDAMLLARFLKLGWLPTGPNPSAKIRQLRALLQAREELVESATKLKNIGHGALTRNGITVEGSAFASARGRQRLAGREGLPDGDRHILLVALPQIEAVEQATDTLEQEIVRRGKDLPGLRCLFQVPGLNLLSGSGLLAEIGDLGWFTNAKQLGAYAGLVPSVRQSRGSERRGRITELGRTRLRTIAIRAVVVMVRKKGTPLGDFYLRKKREKGTGKALCATARKLLTIIFIMLTQQLDYGYMEERLYNKKLRMLQKAA